MIPKNFSAANKIERFLTNVCCRDNWEPGMEINDFIKLPYGWFKTEEYIYLRYPQSRAF